MDEGCKSCLVEVLGCRAGDLPIPYLGLNVRGRINGIEPWKEVINRVSGRVRKWDTSLISMGGRITIIKSILTSIPLYFLSFLKLPKQVEKQIRTLQSNLLWGGSETIKRVAWVKWEVLCKSMKEGGLGIRDLGLFNRALLRKWIWRFLTEKDNLWAMVLKSRHGDLNWGRSGEQGERGGRGNTGWWKMVVARVEGREGQWFWHSLEQVIGDGSEAKFWEGFWSGDKSLKDRFPMLFCLSTKQDKLAKDIGAWEAGRWIWDFGWRQELREREQV